MVSFKPILMNIFVNNLEEGISNTVIKTQRAVLWRVLSRLGRAKDYKELRNIRLKV